eukprot:TRINITY_DN7511_c0_g1_i1.p1 TRINITY_DN7511_c0_g1~~TRINITY_DN7511_c0_g1_i1.p1  ORF type:complete len:201 (+),score=30.72 TRINITY_DN7511_c0_g1_i1:76-678(+)
MPDTWSRIGKTMEVSGEGMVLSRTSGSDFARHATGEEELSTGVHMWEVVLNSGAVTNSNRDMKIGVAKSGCELEKGDHHDKGKAWYLRTHDACLYGGDMDPDDQEDLVLGRGVGRKKGKMFLVGDRIGVRLDCDNGSLMFFKNGEPWGEGFPAGSVALPVVRAVELVCNGQSVTLVPGVELPYEGGLGAAAAEGSSAPAA